MTEVQTSEVHTPENQIPIEQSNEAISHITESINRVAQVIHTHEAKLRHSEETPIADTETLKSDMLEQAEEKLAQYKIQYEKIDPASKARCTWEEFEGRMLANNDHYLKLAEKLIDNGILIGVDNEGNPLFADGGADAAFMMGMGYNDTRKALLNEGYEMFPSNGEYKSNEILMCEAITGKDFVKETVTWIESGKNAGRPYVAFLDLSCKKVLIRQDNQEDNWYKWHGVRRLLRVRKTK
jgi:hypothetical protein